MFCNLLRADFHRSPPKLQQRKPFLDSRRDSTWITTAPRSSESIHKNPSDYRPTCNNAKFCLCNAGISWAAICSRLCTSANTSQLQLSTQWADNYEPARDDMFASFDIKADYPSLQIWPKEHSPKSLDVNTVASASIWRHYQHHQHNPFLALSLIRCCIVFYKTSTWSLMVSPMTPSSGSTQVCTQRTCNSI